MGLLNCSSCNNTAYTNCSKQIFCRDENTKISSDDSQPRSHLQLNIHRVGYWLIVMADSVWWWSEVCRVFVSGRGRGWWWWILAINCITPPRSCPDIRHNPVLAPRHNTVTHRGPHTLSITPFLCFWFSSRNIHWLQMPNVDYKSYTPKIESLKYKPPSVLCRANTPH